MDTISSISLLQSGAALVFVLALIGVISWLLRRYVHTQLPVVRRTEEQAPSGHAIRIVEVGMLDARRRLVRVHAGGKEHLLLLAPDREMLVDSYPQPDSKK